MSAALATVPEAFGYQPEAVPPSGSTVSRWYLPIGPGGALADPNQVVIACRSLLLERLQLPESAPEELEADIYRVAAPQPTRHVSLADSPAPYVLVKAGSVRLPISHAGRRPTKFSKTPPDEAGEGSLVDRLFLQEPGAWNSLRDGDVWEAFRAEAEASEMRGHQLREANRQLARLLLIRAGASPESATRALDGVL
jgi:hypothetical protein